MNIDRQKENFGLSLLRPNLALLAPVAGFGVGFGFHAAGASRLVCAIAAGLAALAWAAVSAWIHARHTR
jgi:uncharacterized membrane protein